MRNKNLVRLCIAVAILGVAMFVIAEWEWLWENRRGVVAYLGISLCLGGILMAAESYDPK